MSFEDMLPDEAKKKFETSKHHYIWLDVRTKAEYEKGHIPGSKLIPMDDLEEHLQELGPKDQAYIVYCHSGGRSKAACSFLSEQGYNHLYNLSGGISDWNGPIEK